MQRANFRNQGLEKCRALICSQSKLLTSHGSVEETLTAKSSYRQNLPIVMDKWSLICSA
jgi:hypothetical protein